MGDIKRYVIDSLQKELGRKLSSTERKKFDNEYQELISTPEGLSKILRTLKDLKEIEDNIRHEKRVSDIVKRTPLEEGAYMLGRLGRELLDKFVI